MAVTLGKSQIVINLQSIVQSASATIKQERQNSQFKKEAEFQRAVADGLSYAEQVKFRQQQLQDEKASPFSDPEYVSKLEESVSKTKKLERFDKYRTKYSQTVGDLSSGKINEKKYLATLEEAIKGVEDPELRLEIQNDITEARKKVKEYDDTILSNHIKKLQYDGTQKTINETISEVATARMLASVNGSESETSAYDETLAALRSQLATTKVQDAISDYQVTSETRGTGAMEKLNFIGQQIADADPSSPVRIGGRVYASAQQYWNIEREGYLSGMSKTFGNFFEEIDAEAKNKVGVSTSKVGFPTQSVLDSVDNTFKEIASRPEMQPYLQRLETVRASTMSEAVDKFAKKVIDAAETSLSFDLAAPQIKSAGTKYGVDTSYYLGDLLQKSRGYEQGNVIPDGSTERLASMVSVELPEIKNTPTKTDTSSPSTAKPSTTGGYTVKSGDTLSGIAKTNNLSLQELIDANPQYKQNPNAIKVGADITLPVKISPMNEKSAAGGAMPESASNQSLPVQGTPVAPVTAPTTPAVSESAVNTAAQPSQQPTNQVTPSTYSGDSITDYLKSTGKDASFASRQKMAIEAGISDYKGSAEQNLKLLKTLRG